MDFSKRGIIRSNQAGKRAFRAQSGTPLSVACTLLLRLMAAIPQKQCEIAKLGV